MSERIAKIQSQLDESRDYLNTVLDQVGDRWDEQVYADGLAWNVRQVVNHLVDSDRGHNNQAMNIAEGRDIIPEDFDIQRYNRRTTEKTTGKAPAQARAELAAARAELNAWLETLDDAKLDMRGRHASLLILSVEQILNWQATHERTHAEDIARALNLTVTA
jgi:hypothetical protein